MTSKCAPAPAHLFAATWQRQAVALSLLALIAFELVYLYSGSAPAQMLARGATLAFYAVAISGLGLRERMLLTVCLALVTGLVWQGNPGAFWRALDQAAFLVAFLQTMGLLREAAVRSAAIRDVGAYLTRQPPKRRNLAVLLGGHAFAMLLNFGSISLLAPLIQRGVRETTPDPEIARIREQRQLSALLRGFSWIVVWSPTTVTQALLVETLPGIDGAVLLGLGLTTTFVMIALAWAEDYATWRSAGARLRSSGRLTQSVMPLPRSAALNLAGICGLLIGAMLAIRWAAEVTTVQALMLTGILGLISWILLQHAPAGVASALQRTGRDLKDVAGHAVPSGARECATLGASGFIGIASAALVPGENATVWAAALHPEPALFLIALPLIIVLAAQFALSPIMMVVFLGSIISALPTPPADMTLTAFALSCGWAITMTSAPNAAGALIMARVTGRPSIELTWRWNLRYSLLAYGLLAVVFTLLARLW